MRNNRRALLLGAAVAIGHLVLLATMVPRPARAPLREPPAMQVILAPLPPHTPPKAPPPRRRRPASNATPAAALQPPIAMPADGPMTSPPAPVADLFAAPFADGRPRMHAYRPPCDFTRDASAQTSGAPCPTGPGEPPLATKDDEDHPQQGSFAAEAKRKASMRSYRDGGAYPGLGCALLHRC